MKQIDLGLAKLQQAITIRTKITALYQKYHSLTKIIENFSQGKIKHYDVKRAVDALYYTGGWPHPSSKSKIDSALDGFAGMFKILTFIGRGNLIKNGLAKRGIQIKLMKSGEIENAPMSEDFAEILRAKHNLGQHADLKSLLSHVVDECQELQGAICHRADVIRDNLRPDIKEFLEIEEPEYERLTDVMKLGLGTNKAKTRIPTKINKVKTSMGGFTAASNAIKEKRK